MSVNIIKYCLAFTFFTFSNGICASSFDCTKASTFAEKTICSDASLSALDNQLMESFKKALVSSHNANKLISEQLAWMKTLGDKCVDTECISTSYNDRIAILNESGSSAVLPTIVSTPNAQIDSANKAIFTFVAKNAAKIAALGFSEKWLKAPIYLNMDLSSNPPQSLFTLEGFLALLFENPRIVKISSITSGKYEGILIKAKGAESAGFLFKYDDGDLFPSHLVKGEQTFSIETMDDRNAISTAIALLAAAPRK